MHAHKTVWVTPCPNFLRTVPFNCRLPCKGSQIVVFQLKSEPIPRRDHQSRGQPGASFRLFICRLKAFSTCHVLLLLYAGVRAGPTQTHLRSHFCERGAQSRAVMVAETCEQDSTSWGNARGLHVRIPPHLLDGRGLEKRGVQRTIWGEAGRGKKKSNSHQLNWRFSRLSCLMFLKFLQLLSLRVLSH